MTFSPLFVAAVSMPALHAGGDAAVRTATVNSIGLVLTVAGLAIQLFFLIRSQVNPAAAIVFAPEPVSPIPLCSALRLGLLLLGLYGLLFVAGPAFVGFSPAPDTPQGRWFLAVQSLFFQGVTLGFVAYALRKAGRGWREAFGIRLSRIGRSLGLALIFYLSAVPHVLIFGLLAQSLLRLAGMEGEMQEVVQVFCSGPSSWLRVYLLVLGIGIAPFAEEVLFRGIALPLLMRRFGTVPAMLMLSLLFAVLHFNVFALVPLFVIGMGFSLSYRLTGDLMVPVLMHALFNLVNFALMRLQGMGP
jgi:hypothetical protein